MQMDGRGRSRCKARALSALTEWPRCVTTDKKTTAAPQALRVTGRGADIASINITQRTKESISVRDITPSYSHSYLISTDLRFTVATGP